MKNNLERDRKRQNEKMKVFQEAVRNQIKDHEDRKQLDRNREEEENLRYRKFQDNFNPEAEKRALEKQKKEEFLRDLENQIRNKRELDYLKRKEEFKEDQLNDNVLIDEEKRRPHREAMEKYYRDRIKSQIRDAEEMKKAREIEDEKNQDYIDRVNKKNDNDMRIKRELEDEKKRFFMNDLERQIADRKKQREIERNLKLREGDAYWAKIEKDHEILANNRFQKKQQIAEYLNDLENQIKNKAMRKQYEMELEHHHQYDNTLRMAEKRDKCYNCAVCLNIYPLKQLNKKRKIIRKYL